MARFPVIFLVAVFFVCLRDSQGCDAQNSLQGSQQFCFNVNCPELPPLTCLDVNSTVPRVVTVLRDGLEVLCDTQTDGGGWLVIQRRVNGTVDFYRTWEDYKYGFGDIDGEFWFGNEKIHRLTTQRRYQLRVDFRYQNNDYFAIYDHFRVFGEGEKYKLEVTGYSGNSGDDLAHHNNRRFSTHDRDNDDHSDNCSVRFHAGWWYGHCHDVNLNGLWGSKEYAKGLTWGSVTGYYASADFSEVKIRTVA